MGRKNHRMLSLRDALENILKNFGSKYQITFA